MEKDYTNYDYLSVSVNTAHLERVLSCYKLLGWKEMRREDDRQYADMKYLALYRRHKIANKDRLQYLQVRMETVINRFSYLQRSSHVKSGLTASLFGVLILGLIAAGFCLLFAVGGVAADVGGAVCLTCAGGGALALSVALPVMRRKERKTTEGKMKEAYALLEKLSSEARTLAPAFESDYEEGGEEVVEIILEPAAGGNI